MRRRICVVTAGHLSTCPRMLKAADALAEAGYHVRVVSTGYVPWGMGADRDVLERRSNLWEWTMVDWGSSTAPFLNTWSALRFRAAKAVARSLGASNCTLNLAGASYLRIHSEVVSAALQEPFDLIYGGASALAAVAVAARRARVPYGLDLEDFHTAERDDNNGADLGHALAERIENDVLRGAAFLTTVMTLVDAYERKYGIRPTPLNNTFPLPSEPPDLRPGSVEGLRLYWFSQTIGPRRGLEDAVRAMGLAGIPGELHLRGTAIPSYLRELERLAVDMSPQLKIVHHEPAHPDAMVDLCGGYDVGLSLEQNHIFNRSASMTNKALTYILAGLPVAFTDTPGQRHLANELGEGAITYKPGDVADFAAKLKLWANDKAQLARARTAAWNAAKRRWHWEHPLERGALLDAVKLALGS